MSIAAQAETTGGSVNRHGSAIPFDVIAVTHRRRLSALAYRILDDHEEAQDVAQETLIRAFRAFDKFRGQSSVYSWLYRIAVNLCRDRIARRRLTGSSPDLLPPAECDEGSQEMEVPDWRYCPEPAVLRKELGEVVQAAIAALPAMYRQVVVLRDLRGLTYQEIADLTGIALPVVKSRLHRARVTLRDRLSDYVLH